MEDSQNPFVNVGREALTKGKEGLNICTVLKKSLLLCLASCKSHSCPHTSYVLPSWAKGDWVAAKADWVADESGDKSQPVSSAAA